ncbi:MAG: 30S ribosome-binding factor RbfA [Candidatus Nanopelagicales bacterium]|nr:30S ribosome-binding factor RbfA [Candidatus Nanopelagicales bacterium]
MSSEARQRKMADRIKVIVAECLEKRVKDPRLGFTTITDVRVTTDLREASVFYTVYGDDQARAETAAALESAKGIIRAEVGRQTGIKFTPSLAFFPDALPENAQHVAELLQRAAEADALVHAQAVNAEYAGDADPYRVPRVDDTELA